MVFHMKTTLVIDDGVMRRLSEEAARRGITMSELVESALRLMLEERQGPRELSLLPTYPMGSPLVDIADRDALYEAIGDD